jgi:hypothetical protein
MRPVARHSAPRRRLALRAALVLIAAAGLLAPAAPAAAPALEGEVARIAAAVERIRGLQFRRPVRPVLLTSTGFGARVRAIMLREYRPRAADRDARLLAALGAIPASTDLRALEAEAVTEQVAGFYDPRTKALVLRVRNAGALNGVERITLAHELDHALTDQALGLPKDPTVLLPSDEVTAGIALVEGDATVVMVLYGVGLGPDGIAAALDPATLGGPSADELPRFLEQQLLFPYLDGAIFVNALRADGGWRRVDRAYRSGPPTTTAQILFPARYMRGEGAVAPAAPGRLPRPWRRVRAQTFGAAALMWLLAAPGGNRARALDDPRRRVAAWAGGRVELWTSGPRSAVAMSLVQRRGARGLCGSVAGWYRRAFPAAAPAPRRTGERLTLRGSRQSAVLACGGGQVRLGIGPSVAAARTLAGGLTPPG